MVEWVAIPFSRRSSQPRDQTQISRIAGRFFTIWATAEAIFNWDQYHLAELHSIRVGAPEMKIPVSSRLYLGPLVERLELSHARFKLGSYWREIWQVPTMGDWPQHMQVFLATDLQTPPAVSLMFTMGHLLEVCPSIHLGSPEQLGEVTLKWQYFRPLQEFWLWSIWFLFISIEGILLP